MIETPSAWDCRGVNCWYGTPSSVMVPASHRTPPPRHLIRVLFPAPLAPNRAWISPGRTVSETPRST